MRSFFLYSLWSQHSGRRCPGTPSPCQNKRGASKCPRQDAGPGEQSSAWALLPVGSSGLMERGCRRLERNQQQPPPSTSFARASILQAEFLRELPTVWQISPFSALQTSQCSSVFYSNLLKIRVYEIPVWAPSERKVDCSFEELFYSIRNWITLKLLTYNELQIKPLAGMKGPKFDSLSQMHTYTWTLIHRMILNS